MLVTYIRSSSYNTYTLCEQQAFLTYTLGLDNPPNKAAEKGSIIHKVMEILAECKLASQNGLNYCDDREFGRIEFTDIMDDEFVAQLVNRSYNYYKDNSINNWELKDEKDCYNWVWKVFEDYNGEFDPRKKEIFWPELHFDIEIPHKWAEYYYLHPKTNEVIYGQLSLKGTIDLITKVNDDTCEVCDFKSGRRVDWASGEEKDFDKLCSDPQLRIYHYALAKTFPHIKYWIITIYFINYGGPYTMSYGPSDIIKTEEMLKKRFEHMKENVRPSLIQPYQKWKCTKLCHFGKTVSPYDESKTICKYIHDVNIKKGIDYVVKNYSSEGHNVDNYKEPGAI